LRPHAHSLMLYVTRERNTVEALKPVPQLGHLLGRVEPVAQPATPTNREELARVGINQRVSLRKFEDDIRRWVEEGRSDQWIASALGSSPKSLQTFRSRNAIYRRGTTSTLYDPKEFSSYEGVLDPEGPGMWFDPEIGSDPRWRKRWRSTERVELRFTPTRIVLLRRGKARGPATR
jgi:DNA-binding CsgD family transcriptional regulator